MEVREELVKVRDSVWEVPTSYKKGMRVPGRIFLKEEALKDLERGAVDQVANVICLQHPEILDRTADIHFGYGFSIGGVAAFSSRT